MNRGVLTQNGPERFHLNCEPRQSNTQSRTTTVPVQTPKPAPEPEVYAFRNVKPRIKPPGPEKT